jgi:hypothetical protein
LWRKFGTFVREGGVLESRFELKEERKEEGGPEVLFLCFVALAKWKLLQLQVTSFCVFLSMFTLFSSLLRGISFLFLFFFIVEISVYVLEA